MRGIRLIPAAALALCALSAPSDARADWRIPVSEPVGVCVDSRGCGGSEPSSSTPYYRGGPIAWGHVTQNGLDKVKDCGNKPFCVMFRLPLVLMFGAVMDGPYYAAKGVGYGLYYGGRGLGKGLYYGGRGIGKGVAYTGAAIGRGLAYPFNRPPKPMVPPATWEQYKHDVLKRQKKLAKAGKAAKEKQQWCVKNVPLEASAGRARWEEACNGDGFVSRAALPPAALMGASALMLTEASATAPAPLPPPSAAVQNPPAPPDAPVAPQTQNNPGGIAAAGSDQAAGETVLPAVPPQAGDSTPSTRKPDSTSVSDASQQQAVNVGIAPAVTIIAKDERPASEAAETSFVGNETPVILSKGSAPSFPSSFGTPEQIGEALAPTMPPASPEAISYVARAAEYTAQQGLARTRAVVVKTAKKAVASEYGSAAVLINMYELPELILPKILEMSRGDLPESEGDLLLFKSVNVLYNFGAAPNQVLSKIFERHDPTAGVIAYGADEASKRLSVAAGKGIAEIAGETHANIRYPQSDNLKGSIAGSVDSLFHQNLKALTTADVRMTAVAAADWSKEIAGAARAIAAENDARNRP